MLHQLPRHVDCILINPRAGKRVYQGLADNLTAIETPIWCLMLATYLWKQGIAAYILDLETEPIAEEDLPDLITPHNPKLVALVCYGHQPSASTQVMPSAIAAGKALGQHFPTVLLGGHPSALPDLTEQQSGCTVIRGEGFTGLANMLGASVPEGNIAHLDDAIPVLEWDMLVPLNEYRAHNWHVDYHRDRSPYASLYTSLSCPFACSFCCIQSPFETVPTKARGYREASAAKVGESIERLVGEYGVHNLKIADEMFVMNRRHVEGVCDEIIKRDLGDSLNIWAYARPDTLRDGMAEKLRAAGFRWLGFGIESASASIREGVDKGYKQEAIWKAREQCQDHDINFGANFIFGLPDDTYITMHATLNLALELQPEYANFYCCVPYPGSALYRQVAAEHPEWLPDDWTGYSQHAQNFKPLPTNVRSARDVLEFRDMAFHCFFENEEWQEYIDSRFGPLAVQHIRQMTSVRMKRDLLS